MISSVCPMLCPLSIRCWANLDFPFLYLKSRRCSRKSILKGLPVWPIYEYLILHVGQVIWYTPHFSYLHYDCWSLVVRSFPIVLLVEYAIFKLVFLNTLVTAQLRKKKSRTPHLQQNSSLKNTNYPYKRWDQIPVHKERQTQSRTLRTPLKSHGRMGRNVA